MTRTDLEQQIKTLIISSLDLEDMTIADIETDVPLFGEGLGLDSIDALELGMAIKKQFHVTFQADQAANRAYFKSVKTLADFIIDNTGLVLDTECAQ